MAFGSGKKSEQQKTVTIRNDPKFYIESEYKQPISLFMDAIDFDELYEKQQKKVEEAKSSETKKVYEVTQ